MTTREPQCVALKRHGAEYVGQLLSEKSKQEELEFWGRRTESLRSRFGRYRARDLILAYMNALSAGDTETQVSI